MHASTPQLSLNISDTLGKERASGVLLDLFFSSLECLVEFVRLTVGIVRFIVGVLVGLLVGLVRYDLVIDVTRLCQTEPACWLRARMPTIKQFSAKVRPTALVAQQALLLTSGRT